MASNSRTSRPDAHPSEGLTSVDEDWDQLRTLLLAPERTQLDELRDQLNNRVIQSRDVSQVLHEAIAVRGEKDPQLSAVLNPYVEHGFVTSVRKSPQVVVDAIAPVMGPAIRQAIARALQSMTQSFNHSLDESLSVRGLRWRLESWRTGRPFAEVVLLKTLRYRVEQVFLIHRETGLLLQHVATNTAVVQDQQVLSGMLTAIQNYVRDSFGASQEQTLDQFHVGEWTVWVEQGSQAYVAAVIRGTPPASLREDLRAALDEIHAEQAETLMRFAGDETPFKLTQPQLESCLQAHYEAPRRPNALKLWILGGAALIALSWLSWTAYQAHARWLSFLTQLRAEPGIVVTVANTTWGGYHLEGLRDPSANDPSVMAVEAGLDPATMTTVWSPYYALEPRLIAARAQSILQPPETVRLRLEGDTLVATGFAPSEWARETKRVATLVPGVSSYRDEGLLTTSLTALLDRINGTVVQFSTGSSTVGPLDRVALSAVTDTLRDVDRAASRSGQRVLLEILGSADNRGSVERNVQLSKERAEAVLAALGGKQLGEVTTVVTDVVSSMKQLGTPGDSGEGRIVRLRASRAAASESHETAHP